MRDPDPKHSEEVVVEVTGKAGGMLKALSGALHGRKNTHTYHVKEDGGLYAG